MIGLGRCDEIEACKFSCGEKTTEPGESLRQRSGAEKNSPGSVVICEGDDSWAKLTL